MRAPERVAATLPKAYARRRVIQCMRIYAETRHESLNELNRDAITEEFAAWARSVVLQIPVAQPNS